MVLRGPCPRLAQRILRNYPRPGKTTGTNIQGPAINMYREGAFAKLPPLLSYHCKIRKYQTGAATFPGNPITNKVLYDDRAIKGVGNNMCLMLVHSVSY